MTILHLTINLTKRTVTIHNSYVYENFKALWPKEWDGFKVIVDSNVPRGTKKKRKR